MIIGIHAIAAFKEKRTGVEEYSYQLIKNLNLLKEAKHHQFILYVDRKPSEFLLDDLRLANNFKIKALKFPFFWTQIRLSLEMLIYPPDILFVPAQIFPLICPKKSVLVVHGLEYEFFPKTYSIFRRSYLRYFTWLSSLRASKIIVPSESTKSDLIRLYKIKRDKIFTVYHGSCEISKFLKFQKTDFIDFIKNIRPYILYLGRIELKKNLEKIIRAYNLAKSKFHIPHKLVLAGEKGFGFEEIKKMIKIYFFRKDVILTGFVSEEEKHELFKNADLFLFPSLYEGFGLPVLESQAFGAPVITSRVSSLPEIAGNGAVFINPESVEEIATAIYRTLEIKSLREELIKNGYENLKRFSWEKSARETLKILL